MLQNRNLSVNDKKRLILLATKEIEQGDTSTINNGVNGNNNKGRKKSPKEGKDEQNPDNKSGGSGTENISSNNNLEDLNNSSKEENDGQNTNHRSGVLGIQYISPQNLQNFLRDYNQDPILRYTCHLIDSDDAIELIKKECKTDSYVFSEHLRLIKKRFNDLRWKFKQNNCQLNPNMITLICVYLTGVDLKGNSKDENGEKISWSSDNVKTTWANEEILQWSKDHPVCIPNPGPNIEEKQNNNSGYILLKRFKSRITGTAIKSFSELVVFFKSQFHIRQDNSLKSILEIKNKQWEPKNAEIEFSESSFNNSVELFTDVGKLIQAYEKIINLCIECRSNEYEPVKIVLCFYDDMESKHSFFTIHHLNSIYKKTSKSAIERLGEKHAELISKQINGLCDLYIEAKFGDNKCGRINLWDEKSDFDFLPINDDFSGVKYILRF